MAVLAVVLVSWSLKAVELATAEVQIQGDKTKKGEEMQRFLEEWGKEQKERSGPIVVRGTLTDENGTPLNDVNCRIDNEYNTGAFEGGWRSSRQTVSSPFELAFEESGGVELRFSKDGYQSRTISLRYKAPRPERVEAFGKVRFQDKAKIYEDVAILLPSDAGITRMGGYGMYLTLHPNGDRQVFDLGNPLKRGGPEVDHAYGAKLIHAGDPISSGTIFVEAVPAKKAREPLVRGGQYDWPPNQDLLIVLDDGQGGGMIRAKPEKDKHFPDKKLSWFMRKAPDGEYEKRLRITQDDWAPFRNGERVHFYCRVNGKYGKGDLSAGYTQQEGYRVDIRFLYQPDGSRNVETKE